jgi:PAS domain S-box-containing protein
MPGKQKKTRKTEQTKKKIIVKKKVVTNPKQKKSSSKDNEFFDAIFNNSEFGVAIFQPNGKILKVNKVILDFLGYTEKELNELTIAKISYPQDHALTEKFLSELLEGKRTQYKAEKRYIAKNGKIVPTKLSVQIAQKKNGKVTQLIGIIEDLTEKNEILDKLETEQTLLNALLKNIPDSIYFKDRKSRFVKVNAAKAVKHKFATPDEIIGKSDFDLYGKEHSTTAFNDEQQIISTNTPLIDIEEKIDLPDGKMRYGSTTKMPWYDKYGNIIGTFGITRDITEKVLNQEEVKSSEFLYRSLFTNSVDGIFLLDTVVKDCNQAVCDLLQYERMEFIGLFPSDFSPQFQPDGRASLESMKAKISATLNGAPQRFYWVYQRKDGKLVDTEISLSPVMISGQKLVQAVVRDITERLRDEKLREALFVISETAYTASDMYNLYQKVHEVVGRLMPAKNFYISLYDEKTDTLSFPYFVDEYDPPQATKKMGRGLTEYVLRQETATLIDSKKDYELRKMGEVDLIGAPQAVWLGVPLKIAGKTTGVIVVQHYEDEKAYGEYEVQILTFVAAQVAQVIERKRNADEMKKITNELQQLNATKDKFFSIIAHDLRNPFITILGFSDLLITDYFELTDEERKFYLEEMKKSAELSHNLLQNLLQWSRSQTGRIEFNQSTLPLKNMVNSNLELLEGTAAKKGIQLISEIPENMILFADEDMLNVVIRNLLTNAIKFTQRNGIIHVSAYTNDSKAEISVKDSGVGMDDSALNNLFRIDVSHSSYGTNNEVGTGLGLILCKEFIEKHGGKISVISEPGKGSTFTFTIPISQ